MATATAQKHPKGLYVLFSTEMWERFSFYTMNGMVVLYVTNAVQGFGWSNAQATNVFSYYLMFVYASPLIGGFIADRWTGPRHAITIGGLFFMAGHLLLAVPKNIPIFYVALTCLVIGNGFFKPNVSTMVGNLYPEGSHLKDRAYLIFYMGINIGAALAPIVAEIVQGRWGYHYAFAVAAFGMMISLAVFWGFQKYVRGADVQRGGDFMKKDSSHGSQDAKATAEDLPPVANEPVLNEAAQQMNAVPEWKRIMALIVIFLIVIVFWMVFHQNSSTLTLWADDHTAWNVSGILSNAINPIWIILLSLPLAGFWSMLDRRNMEPSTPAKMMIGMMLTGLSFIVLYFAAQAGGFTKPAMKVLKVEGEQAWVTTSPEATKYLKVTAPAEPVEYQVANPETGEMETLTAQAWRASSTGGELEAGGFAGFDSQDGSTLRVSPQNSVSPWWLIMAYGVLSLGELMLSPMGLSLVSKVAPIRMRGLMMGGWFLATAIGNKLTAIGNYWDLWSHARFFIILASMALFMAVVLFVLLKPLKKAMPGV